MATCFQKQGDTYHVTSDAALARVEKLPPALYAMQFHIMRGFFFKAIEPFSIPKKLYGNVEKLASKILNTFESRNATTGVLLCGEKGSGKTLTTKQIINLAISKGIPAIVVNEPFVGNDFNETLSRISQPIVLLFDEFEKTYKDETHQAQLLTFLDGVMGGNRLTLLTANDSFKINAHMKNRPGRLFYFIDYKGLSPEFITEYCEEKLNDKSLIKQILTVSALFDALNFDMLQALVEEMNRYPDQPVMDALKILNVKPTFGGNGLFKFTLEVDGKKIDVAHLEDKKNEITVAPLHPNGVSVGYYVNGTEDDNDSKYERVYVRPHELTAIDPTKGLYTYVSGLNKLTLERVAAKPQFYEHLL